MAPSTNGQQLRIGAVGDLHCPRTSAEDLHALFARMAGRVDVVLLCGDITDYGKPEEAEQLVPHLSPLRGIPILAVLGNHDFECGQEQAVAEILGRNGVTILDGTAIEVQGVGFVGVKGFAGGFGDRALQPWGETVLKQFVQESVQEALKLESGLAKLRTDVRIVLMHYSPLVETVQGEAPEIIPFLGSSRLEEPLDRYSVTAVFHGHAHHGTVEGRSRTGVPVYNVALPLLQRRFPDQSPMRLIEVAIPQTADR